MNQQIDAVRAKQAERAIESLEKHGIHGYFFRNRQEAVDQILSMISKNQVLAFGRSKTMDEIGLYDLLQKKQYCVMPIHTMAKSPQENRALRKLALQANVFFTSTNALTENGELYNVDGTGNRVAAMAYGPDKVFVVLGINKLVPNMDDAIRRVKRICGPAVNIRANSSSPCTKTEYCVDCATPERKCNVYSVIKHQRDTDRMHVFIINETLGY